MNGVPRQILKDKNLDNRLKEDGYVVVPFLDEEEVNTLTAFFHEHHKDGVGGFYATAHVPDTGFREMMGREINRVYERGINEYFTEARPLGGSFIVKPPGEESVLQPHQDWNIVDESVNRSYNVWVPLVDLNEKNGTILVMPGSHDWVRGYRHISIPCVYGKVYGLVLQNMTPLYLKAGEALIHDHALVHASEANRSDGLRIACAYGIISSGAKMLFYWNNNGQVEEYESNPEFFMKENVFTGPHHLKKIKDVDYDFHQIDEDEFYALSKIPKPVLPQREADYPKPGLGIWGRIKKMIG